MVWLSPPGVGGPVATEPKVRFRLEPGPSGEALRTGLDPKLSFATVALTAGTGRYRSGGPRAEHIRSRPGVHRPWEAFPALTSVPIQADSRHRFERDRAALLEDEFEGGDDQT